MFALLDEHKHTLRLNVESQFHIVAKKLGKVDPNKLMAIEEKNRDEFFEDYIEEQLDA